MGFSVFCFDGIFQVTRGEVSQGRLSIRKLVAVISGTLDMSPVSMSHVLRVYPREVFGGSCP